MTTLLTIREVGVDEKNIFAEFAIAGFGMPPPMALWLSQLVGRPNWHAYASFDGDRPAGAAALYVDGDFAWLGIGATRPEMRKKGGQIRAAGPPHRRRREVWCPPYGDRNRRAAARPTGTELQEHPRLRF